MNPFLPILLLFLLTGHPVGVAGDSYAAHNAIVSSQILTDDQLALKVVFQCTDKSTEIDSIRNEFSTLKTFCHIEGNLNRTQEDVCKSHVRFRDGPIS